MFEAIDQKYSKEILFIALVITQKTPCTWLSGMEERKITTKQPPIKHLTLIACEKVAAH